MNINQYLSKPIDFPKDPHQLWDGLLQLREKTFKGFAALEEKKGLLRVGTSFSTAHGQEMFRLLLFRVLEEAAESAMSESRPHVKEEAIDAINYLLAIPFVDTKLFDRQRLLRELVLITETTFSNQMIIGRGSPLTVNDLGIFTLTIGGDLADSFRNRAWMENSQDVYFSGLTRFYAMMSTVLSRLLLVFEDQNEFVQYYVAKDKVLQFRLSSHY